MREPKIVKILDCSEKRLYNLPDIEFKCRLQKRDATDTSKVVYITNPWFKSSETTEANSENQFLAFCEGEYEVVKWTKKTKSL
jgi:hypothetical protein